MTFSVITSIFTHLKNFMKFTIFLLALIGIFFSCQNSVEEEIKETNYGSNLIFGDSNYIFPILTAPAQEQAIRWGVLEDFIAETQKLNGSNFNALKNGSERLTQYSDSLFRNIPDTLNINPIQSRLLVMKTRAQLLYQSAHSAKMDSTEIQNSVMEMNNAVKNLIIQMNEKFQKDFIDSQRIGNEQMELKAQKRYQDSIMDLERQDLKNRKL